MKREAKRMSGESKGKFQRIEKKFWMTGEQYEALLPILEAHARRDAYGPGIVCNVYCDTPDYALIRRSIQRPFFKEKLRLRSYGYPKEEDPVFVEMKRKVDGVGYKRRICLPLGEARRLLTGERTVGSGQIERELREFIRRYRPLPRVVLSYERFALAGKEDPELRLTVDGRLRYRLADPEHPSAEGLLPILEDDERRLLEVKTLHGLPPWLREALSGLRIYQAPFSKIGTCFERHIAPALRPADCGKEGNLC